MKSYKIWYQTNPTFWPDKNLTKKKLNTTHKFLTEIQADDLEDVFYKMQADNWSPNGEARPLILSLGLHHTSMSCGDVIQDGKQYYQCDVDGWTKVK